jgi:diaminopimelate decarboxylase
MSSPIITTPLSPKLQTILSQQSVDIFSHYERLNHHFHIYDPSQQADNIRQFQDICTKRDLNASIHMAHKANDHCSFLKQAKQSGINIEVASLHELEHVLDHGFVGQEIIA